MAGPAVRVKRSRSLLLACARDPYAALVDHSCGAAWTRTARGDSHEGPGAGMVVTDLGDADRNGRRDRGSIDGLQYAKYDQMRTGMNTVALTLDEIRDLAMRVFSQNGCDE